MLIKKNEWNFPVCKTFSKKSQMDFVHTIYTMCGHDKILYVVFLILSAGLFTLKTDFTNSTTLLPDVYEKKKKISNGLLMLILFKNYALFTVSKYIFFISLP